MSTSSDRHAVTPEDLKALYLCMLRIRVVEEELVRRYPEQEMRCPVHFCIGQEAVPAGVGLALDPRDTVMSTHRSHGHYLARGGDLGRMVAEFYGRETGTSRGKGGSMHLVDRGAGFWGATSIVSGIIPVAVGAAMAHSRLGTGAVSVVFFGDAATEEGAFSESLNFAALHRLPVLFVCENNLYSTCTPIRLRQAAGRRITAVARANGVPAAKVDGNDARALFVAAGRALEGARRGGGPFLIEAATFRHLEHCGPREDHLLGMRDAAEVQMWKAKDPVIRMERRLVRGGILGRAECDAARERFLSETREAVSMARSAPFPAPREVLEDVFGS